MQRVRTTTHIGVSQQQNAGKTLHQGVEYSFKAKIRKDLSIRISGTNAVHQFTDYTEAVKGEEVDYSNKLMPQSPGWIMNSQITYKPSYIKGFRSSIEWQHVDRYFMEKGNVRNSIHFQ